MWTKKIVSGVIKCPGCQKKFRTKAQSPVQQEAKHSPHEKEERIRMLVMAPFGAFFLFFGLVAIASVSYTHLTLPTILLV